MPYQRRILHYGPQPNNWIGTIADEAIRGCWFELHRQGGCGAGELRLLTRFVDRGRLTPGQWIACEYQPGDRWYLGQIQSCQTDSPAGMTIRLEGMAAQLSAVFPGGFHPLADGAAPHRYGRTDLFSADPDWSWETVDSADRPEDIVRLLLRQYVVPATDIQLSSTLIEDAAKPTEIMSLKFRGEESVQSILKDLATRSGGAAYGVDERGQFYFLRPRVSVIGTFQEGGDLVRLRELRSYDYLYNRLLLTGGYVYGALNASGLPNAQFRWRGNYLDPVSIDQYGERRIRLWVPWVRTIDDARGFARGFFQRYAQPTTRVEIEAPDQTAVLRPWTGRIAVHLAAGGEPFVGWAETVRVTFDHQPRLRLTIGPEDPHTLWPEPPHDERYPIARHVSGYGGGTIRQHSQLPLSSQGGQSQGGGGSHRQHSSRRGHSSSRGDSLHHTSRGLRSSQRLSSAVIGSSGRRSSRHHSSRGRLSSSYQHSSGLGSSLGSIRYHSSGRRVSSQHRISSQHHSGQTHILRSSHGYRSSAWKQSSGQHHSSIGGRSSITRRSSQGQHSSQLHRSSQHRGSSVVHRSSGGRPSSGITRSSQHLSQGTHGHLTHSYSSQRHFASTLRRSSGMRVSSHHSGRSTHQPTSSIATMVCEDCHQMPRRWRVTIAGTQNGQFANCAAFNGTYILQWTGSSTPCRWQASTSLATGGVLLTMSYTNGTFLLELGSVIFRLVAYQSTGQIVCGQSCVLTRTGSPLSCQWPATLTIFPA